VLELDTEQRYAVEFDESLVVISGPGSGKTRMLTEKARQEFNSGKDILCLTFTKSAAKEMQDRVPGLPACTIHSYCCGLVGWKDGWSYDGLLERFLWEKDKRRFDMVLLDEAQDVNELELDVVLSLVGDKLFVVGDPFQSIYGFQGAMGYGIIDELASLGIGAVELHNNYRSCPKIIKGLNGIFERGLVSKGVKDTGLTATLCRTNDDLFYLSKSLKELEVPHRLRVSIDRASNNKRETDILGESNLRLSTIHCSKGLEFDNVILYDWRPDGTEEEKRVFYVAMARASKEYTEVDTLEELQLVLGLEVR